MAPFVATSSCVRNRCSIDAIKHDARHVGLHHVPIPERHHVLLRAVRDVRGGGDDATADNDYEYLADTDTENNSISDGDGESDILPDDSSPIGPSSPPTSTTTSADEANSIIASFEEELVRIRLQIEAEAEREWEMWRKQMLERRRVRKRLLQINQQKEEEEKEKQEEEEKVEVEPEVRAEPDTSTNTDAVQYEDERTESLLVDESEGTALESEIVLLDDDEGKEMEEEEKEDSSTSDSSQVTDVVDEVAPLEDKGGKDENLEDSTQIQDNVDSKEEDESGYDEQTTMDDHSQEAFGIQGYIDDGEEDDSDAQEDIGFIGDYDAPTDSDDELSGYEEEEAFQEEFERKDISVHSEVSNTATSNMKVESDDVDDLNVPVERQVNESDDLACNIPKKRRKQKQQKKKKKKKRKKSQRETAQAEERSDDTGRTSLGHADVALVAPTKENSSALRPPSFTRKVVFYVGFAAFLSLFKMILDALVRKGLQ